MTALPDSITTERLTLRAWRLDDAEALTEAITESVEHLRPWMPWASAEPLSVEQRRTMMEGWQASWRDGGDVVVGALVDGRVAGGAGLHRRGGPNELEIGYWVRASEIRKGYCTEMVRGLVELAFTIDRIDRLIIHHDRANKASAGVARSAGFTFVREQPDEVTAPGEDGVDWEWELTRSAWAER